MFRPSIGVSTDTPARAAEENGWVVLSVFAVRLS